MKQIMCAVFDAAAQTYGRPIFVVHRAQAVRTFRDEINRLAGDNVMAAHPTDFELYFVGTFDDATGEFADLPKFPELIVRGVDVVNGSAEK